MTDYDHIRIEKKWQDYWAANKTFRTPELKGKKKFYALDFFPYPSGVGLHVGHPLGYTATDILSRFKRMQNFAVLHPMGWDAFGLPAEQHAISTGEHPAIITKKNCEIFGKQLQKVGLSFDWEREFATCDPSYYKWTQWIFLKIYNSWFDEKLQKARPIEELPIPEEIKKQGELAVQQYQADRRLAYNADAMVNWCPELGTVLANEEVIDGKSERGGYDVVRRPMKQWMLRITKYADRLISELNDIDWPESISEQQRNWIGRKTGAEIVFKVEGQDQSLTAFTTRPDTLFGVTFFVISPEHPLAGTLTTPEMKEKVEQYRAEAQAMSELARTIENRKKTGVFTGSFVVNPINNETVPLYVGDYVLMTFGTGAVMGVPAHDERDFEFARTFQIDIRPVIRPVEASEEITTAVTEGEIAWTAPGVMLPCTDRVASELGIAGKSNEDAGKVIVGWLEKKSLGRGVVNYKLRDWLFSRQRYWGEPIPIIHWEDGRVTAVPEKDLPLVLPEVKDYKPSEGGESPLAKAAEWVTVRDPKTGKQGRRETNTMPNWAGSCWYYLRFMDPKNDAVGWDPKIEKEWAPVDLYMGGAEHAVLHLLYARFWHKILYDLGYASTKEPFQRLRNQGMIQAYAYKNVRGVLIPTDQVEEREDGGVLKATGEKLERVVAKMSKSLRNVVGLGEITEEYGADSLRMYLMFMGPIDTGRVWDPKAIIGNYRFIKKLWNFVIAGKAAGIRDTIPADQETPEVRRAVNLVVKRVTKDIDQFQFNTAIAAMMECLNSIGDQPLSKESIEKIVLVVSPFAPHVCEELWERLGHKGSLAYEQWPTFDPSMLQDETVTVVIQVNGKKRATIDVAPGIDEKELKSTIVSKLSATEYKVADSDRFITVFQPKTTIPRLVNVIKS